jgi:hypothetical protein
MSTLEAVVCRLRERLARRRRVQAEAARLRTLGFSPRCALEKAQRWPFA